MNTRELFLTAFQCALNAAKPDRAVRQAVESIQRPMGRTVVVGGGKAAASMAKALEDAWEDELTGVVVTRYGHATEQLRRIKLLEASHPVPDNASELAGTEILETLQGLSSDDLVIVLISGGGSALMVAPIGVTLEEKLLVNRQLLNSGADIVEMNTVRKHLSSLKGGRLALAAAPARVIALIVSDVVGDDLSTIASGPTVPDPTTFQDAIQVFEKYQINSPAALEYFQTSLDETPKPGHPAFGRVENQLIVTNVTALEAAQVKLEVSGIRTRIHSDSITGEARDAARLHALEARKLEPGTAFLSGGETTVTVRGTGRGGRNCEFLLALAIQMVLTV
jgi:glycerate 2-kinase